MYISTNFMWCFLVWNIGSVALLINCEHVRVSVCLYKRTGLWSVTLELPGHIHLVSLGC